MARLIIGCALADVYQECEHEVHTPLHNKNTGVVYNKTTLVADKKLLGRPFAGCLADVQEELEKVDLEMHRDWYQNQWVGVTLLQAEDDNIYDTIPVLDVKGRISAARQTFNKAGYTGPLNLILIADE